MSASKRHACCSLSQLTWSQRSLLAAFSTCPKFLPVHWDSQHLYSTLELQWPSLPCPRTLTAKPVSSKTLPVGFIIPSGVSGVPSKHWAHFLFSPASSRREESTSAVFITKFTLSQSHRAGAIIDAHGTFEEWIKEGTKE